MRQSMSAMSAMSVAPQMRVEVRLPRKSDGYIGLIESIVKLMVPANYLYLSIRSR